MKRQFDAGETIFKEGEPSLAAYVVAAGEVELTKEGPNGPVVLAVVGKGDLFGEMGVIDKGPRSASARARSAVSVEVVPRSDFLNQIETRPQMALKVMAKMAERLRAADATIVELSRDRPAARGGGGGKRAAGGKGGGPLAFLQRLFGRRAPGSAPAATAAERNGPMVILVASVNGDFEGAPMAKRIVATLEGMPGITVRHLAQSLAGGGPAVQSDDPAAWYAETLAHARRLLTRHNADVIVWGDVEEDSNFISVRFLSAGSDERPGAVTPDLPLTLALDFEDAWAYLLRAATLAGLDPRTDQQIQSVRTALLDALPNCHAVTENARLPGMGADEQAQALVAFGNAAAAAGNFESAADWHASAITVYRKALRFLSGPIERTQGLVNRLLGLAYQAAGERTDDPEFLERAVDAYKTASLALTRDTAPREWGSLNNRMGLLLYRLDTRTARPEPLKESLAAFQAALQVISRADDPLRWSEVMNNLAQALQVYGDRVKSVDLMHRAVDVCRAALEVRHPETMPLLWAASQNNLGSALFLVARLSGDSALLRQSVDAFRGALQVYEVHGAARMAQVAEKNLVRAERLLETKRRRRVARPDWAGETDEDLIEADEEDEDSGLGLLSSHADRHAHADGNGDDADDDDDRTARRAGDGRGDAPPPPSSRRRREPPASHPLRRRGANVEEEEAG